MSGVQSVLDIVHDSKGFIVPEPERSVIKATRHEAAPPKEKHVRKLVKFSNQHVNSYGLVELAISLQRRLESSSWQVVIRALICYHRIFNDSMRPSRLMTFLVKHHEVFKSVSLTRSDPSPQCYFAENYATYLTCKLWVFAKTGRLLEQEKLSHTSLKDKLACVDFLLRQLQALVRCNCPQIGRAMPWAQNLDPITLSALNMLVKESVSLYQALNECLLALLEMFFGMQLGHARDMLNYYQGFVLLTQQLNEFYRNCSSFISKLSFLSLPPKETLSSMKAYVTNLESQEAENPHPAANSAQQAPHQPVGFGRSSSTSAVHQARMSVGNFNFQPHSRSQSPTLATATATPPSSPQSPPFIRHQHAQSVVLNHPPPSSHQHSMTPQKRQPAWDPFESMTPPMEQQQQQQQQQSYQQELFSLSTPAMSVVGTPTRMTSSTSSLFDPGFDNFFTAPAQQQAGFSSQPVPTPEQVLEQQQQQQLLLEQQQKQQLEQLQKQQLEQQLKLQQEQQKEIERLKAEQEQLRQQAQPQPQTQTQAQQTPAKQWWQESPQPSPQPVSQTLQQLAPLPSAALLPTVQPTLPQPQPQPLQPQAQQAPFQTQLQNTEAEKSKIPELFNLQLDLPGMQSTQPVPQPAQPAPPKPTLAQIAQVQAQTKPQPAAQTAAPKLYPTATQWGMSPQQPQQQSQQMVAYIPVAVPASAMGGQPRQGAFTPVATQPQLYMQQPQVMITLPQTQQQQLYVPQQQQQLYVPQQQPLQQPAQQRQPQGLGFELFS
eukprot:TRINITY_DN4460_c0_g4_i2.p1 TRINITY_DN4460_c0_g4~~TRINITY_DN4460_c0_g4_i2.p1  ORF type:complete len:790 (-),score=263.79 TRINITY_DN4460_c0_g4_i2:77-2386(-)